MDGFERFAGGLLITVFGDQLLRHRQRRRRHLGAGQRLDVVPETDPPVAAVGAVRQPGASTRTWTGRGR